MLHQKLGEVNAVVTMIVGLSGALHISSKISALAGSRHTKIDSSIFPDGETYVRFPCNIKGMDVILVQSFYHKINDQLVEALFAGRTARALGAKSATLLALYFPYLRQDKMFRPGEAVSIHVLGDVAHQFFDRIIIMDPHLHREKNLGAIFLKMESKKLSADPLIAEHIKKTVKKPLIIGPDIESFRWAQKTAEIVGCGFAILQKKRHGPRKVTVTLKSKIDLKDHELIIVDDIISTGHTIIETVRQLRKLGAKRFTCYCVHAVFVKGAYERLKDAGIKVISCNTIPHESNRIDVSPVFSSAII